MAGCDNACYKSFRLAIENSRFEYEKPYSRPIDKVLPQPVIDQVNVNVLLFMRRNDVVKPSVPKLKVAGKVSDITVNLTPYTYSHLVNLSSLLAADTSSSTPNSFAKLKKQAQFSGHLSKQRHMIKYLDKYYGILASGNLFFFKEDDGERVAYDEPTLNLKSDTYSRLESLYRQNGLYFKPDDSQRVAEEWFSIKGCEKCERLSPTSLKLSNYY